MENTELISENKLLNKIKKEFTIITLKSDYMDRRRKLENSFILFSLFNLTMLNSKNEDEVEKYEEICESLLSLNKKISKKAEVILIDLNVAEKELVSCLKNDSNDFPVYALAHPHIPDIDILLNNDYGSVYKTVLNTFEYYTSKYENDKNETLERIDKLVKSFPVIVFIKGTPLNPFCKFSKSFMEIIKGLNCDYRAFDIFTDEKLRGFMKFYHGFKTFPQLFINGKLIGGLDILTDLVNKNQLEIPISCSYNQLNKELLKLIEDNKLIKFIFGDTNQIQSNEENKNNSDNVFYFDLNKRLIFKQILEKEYGCTFPCIFNEGKLIKE